MIFQGLEIFRKDINGRCLLSTVEMLKARSLIEQLVLLSAGRQVEFRGESWTMKAPLVENEDIHLGRNLEKLQLTSQYASCRLHVVFMVCWVIEVFHHLCLGHPKHCSNTVELQVYQAALTISDGLSGGW